MTFFNPACFAASAVKLRATSSKLAGTVSTTAQSSSLSSAARFGALFQASTRCRRYLAETASGDRRFTSGGAAHGKSGAVRSTPGWHSHDLAEETSRPGILAPWVRANAPTTSTAVLSHGRAVAPAGKSVGPGRYRNDGSSGRLCTSPGATSCATGNVVSLTPPAAFVTVST